MKLPSGTFCSQNPAVPWQRRCSKTSFGHWDADHLIVCLHSAIYLCLTAVFVTHFGHVLFVLFAQHPAKWHPALCPGLLRAEIAQVHNACAPRSAGAVPEPCVLSAEAQHCTWDTGSASWLCLGRTGRVRREVSKQNPTKRSVRSAQLGLHGILGSTARPELPQKKLLPRGEPHRRAQTPHLSLGGRAPGSAFLPAARAALSTHCRRPGPAARTAALCPAAASAPRPAPGLCQPSAAAPAPVSPDNGRGPPRRPPEPLSGTGTAAPRSSRRAASPLPSAAPSSPRGAPAPPPPGPQSPSPGARQPRTCRRARPAGRRGLRAAAGWRRGDTWGRRGQRRRQEFPRQLEVAAVAPPPRVPVRGERPPRSSLLTNTQRAAPGPGRGRVWRRHGRQEEPDQVGQRRRLPGARSGARGRRRWRPGGPAAGGAPRAAPRAVCLRRPKRQPKPSSDEGYWDCSVCTFRNSAEAFKCMMCDVRKGTSTRWVPARGPRFARRRPWQRRGRVRRGGPGRAGGFPPHS